MSAEITSPEPGIHEGIPEEVYHYSDQWQLVSSSMLRLLAKKTPAHVKAMLMGQARAPTEAMVFGSAVHRYVLEHDTYHEAYVAAPDGHPNSNAHKEAKAKLLLAGKTVLKQDTLDAVAAVGDAVLADEEAAALLAGKHELSLVWDDEETGLRCKARLDAWAERLGAVTDLKTTADATEDAFSRDAWNLGYGMQAAHYLAGARACGLDARHFTVVAVEKTPPHLVWPYRLLDRWVEVCEDQRRGLLQTMASCLESGLWPGRPRGVTVLSPPSWAWSTIE